MVQFSFFIEIWLHRYILFYKNTIIVKEAIPSKKKEGFRFNNIIDSDDIKYESGKGQFNTDFAARWNHYFLELLVLVYRILIGGGNGH